MSTPDFPDACWPFPDTDCCPGWDDYDGYVQDRAVALASSTMRALTLYRVGGCPITIRPCVAGTCNPTALYGGGTFYPIVWNGTWTNCGCPGTCIHNGIDLAQIGFGEIVGPVSGVLIDGEPFTDYVKLGTVLARTDGLPWPPYQDMTLPNTEVGTWSITYLPAHEVDVLGAYAVGVLACEYAAACTGKECRLPDGVVSVTRAGIQYTIAPGAFPNGYTGINEVDAYLRRWNPTGLAVPPMVWTPARRAYTWQAGV